MQLTIKKGLDLRIAGSVPEAKIDDIINVKTDTVGICPDDFPGFVPKTAVKAGDKVMAGDALMYDKNFPQIKLVSPVSGTVKAVERGERRHIECIVVENDFTGQARNVEFDGNLAWDDCIKLLAENGLLAYIRRRPFADIPYVDVRPRDIFVTAFDSAPLAVDHRWTAQDKEALQAGVDFLKKITANNVYVSVRQDSTFPELKHAETVYVHGPHPAGLPGIQAANIAPVNKGETIWTMDAATLWRIGQLIINRCYDPTAWVAVTGSCVTEPYIARCTVGAQIKPLIENKLADGDFHMRVISGNVLVGIKTNPATGYLHFPYEQVTVIPEGDDVDEFMGWASVSNNKMSVSPSFPGHFFKKLFNPDARINGGRRAMIMSGKYDKVVPMDILTDYLIKAINGRDIENMEKLGIFEVAPEDFALAECLDSSKQPLQAIVRAGLDFLRNELQ